MIENDMRITVNGNDYQLPAVPGEMLADLLRERLHLTGTKVACGESECGACTVILDGKPVLSCNVPAIKAHGRSVITIEGIAQAYRQQYHHPESHLHPLQEAFVATGAVQCGFCIPGQLMTAFGLLQENPDPDEEDIKAALKDTLCRCGSYPSFIRAIQAAAKTLRDGTPVEVENPAEARQPGDVVGRFHPRADASAKVTGAAVFTDDLVFPDMLHARVKRALVPSGVVKAIHIERAAQLTGVVAILTAADIPGEHQHGLVVTDWPSLVGIGEEIRTIGDAIAIVAAETRVIASQALELIDFEYEPLPVIASPRAALKADQRQLHLHGNLLKHIKVRKGDIAAGFQDADHIFEHSYFTPMHDHAFMEPECSLARPLENGRMEIYVGSQIPYSDRDSIARALAVSPESIHVRGQLIGGGFGGKEDIAGQIHAALLAQRTGRPVKLRYDRHESLIAHPKRHATEIRVKLGMRNNGRLTAVETELYGDTGAYASLGEKVMTRATTHSSGPYEIPHVKADCYAVYTNNPPAGAFRGFGVLQSAFAIESIMDEAASQLSLSPIDLRKINALRTGSLTNTGQLLTESVGLSECISLVEKALEKSIDGDPFMPRTVPGNEHLVRAWGFAVAYKNTGLGGGAPDKASAEIELRADGTFEARTSSAELGQGLPTVLQLIAAETLHQPPSNLSVLLSDTDLTPDGGPTTASRQTFVTGNAVRYAAQKLLEWMISNLAELYDVPPSRIFFREGLAHIDDLALTMREVAAKLLATHPHLTADYTYFAPQTSPLGTPGDMHFAYSFAAQAAQVEVNRHNGEVSVRHVIAANDVGYAINPLGLRAQMEGGIIMGIGHALSEAFLTENGYAINDRLARYRMPSIAMTPRIETYIVEHGVSAGPFGAKGVGEIVLIPTIPAITNAIFHATGVRVDHLPVDQELIFRQLNPACEA